MPDIGLHIWHPAYTSAGEDFIPFSYSNAAGESRNVSDWRQCLSLLQFKFILSKIFRIFDKMNLNEFEWKDALTWFLMCVTLRISVWISRSVAIISSPNLAQDIEKLEVTSTCRGEAHCLLQPANYFILFNQDWVWNILKRTYWVKFLKDAILIQFVFFLR